MTTECLDIASEELLQRQRVLAGHDADRISDVVSLRAFGDSRSKVLPKVREVIEGVWIEPILHGFGPLLICDLDISDWSLKHSAQSLDDLVHCGNFTDQFIHLSKRHAGIGKKSGGHARYILSPYQRKHPPPTAQPKEDGIFYRDALQYQSPDLLVIWWRLKMNRPDLRPIEDAISQPVLQITKARRLRRTLKLRIVDHQFRAGIAGCRGE